MAETNLSPVEAHLADKGPNFSLSHFLRRNFFASWGQSVLTVIIGVVVVKLTWMFIDWAVIHSVWTADGREMCREEGACWSVIAARWRLILFGLYPPELQWRAGIASAAVILMVALTCIPRFFRPLHLLVIWGFGFAIYFVLMRGGPFGLEIVPTDRWGGLPLTLFIYAAVIFFGMPLAVLIALGRRSRFWAIRLILSAFVDIFRSLPLLAVLFTFSLVIPFFLPPNVGIEKVYRVIIGFALFFACYQSEIVRGGLQSVPPGQDEAARALGLGYFTRLTAVILPQAFRNAMPMTINQFVISFKETAIIVVVGLFELLAAAQASFGTAEWGAYYKEVYLFVAAIYFVFSFSLTQYGRWLERNLAGLHQR